ncbi:MAG TPA: tetratricopeptide repeat protein [Rhizomicrobium sp.]|nr:tetratricopeptide repeat protein [Rhizomicrobium sp.]
MSALPYIGLAVVALAAVGFVAWPLLRERRSPGKKAVWLLAGAVALFVLGIGAGTYLVLGRPHLAARSAMGLKTDEVNGLVPFLIERVRKYPNDSRAWRYLGQLYSAARDPADAARAYARAIAIEGKGDPALDAAYGEALVMQNDGNVPDQAVEAFHAAITAQPSNVPARFYLGLAKAQRNDRQGAIQAWQALLTDVPDSAPLHQLLVDRIAMLTAAAGGPGGRPDPRAMVAMLEARLKADPNDAPGWVRLVRAWHVLGEDDKARAALATARKTFAGNKEVLAAFDTAEKDLK